jgi:hypothetical protein
MAVVRHLTGGKCLELKNAYGFTLPSVYQTCDMFFDAVNLCPYQINRIKRPQTLDEMTAVMWGFEEHSTPSQLTLGCVGYNHRFLATTTRPTMKDSNNIPGTFFSSHYGIF